MLTRTSPIALGPLDGKRTAQRTTIAGGYKVGRYLDETLDRDRKVRRLVD